MNFWPITLATLAKDIRLDARGHRDELQHGF